MPSHRIFRRIKVKDIRENKQNDLTFFKENLYFFGGLRLISMLTWIPKWWCFSSNKFVNLCEGLCKLVYNEKQTQVICSSLSSQLWHDLLIF